MKCNVCGHEFTPKKENKYIARQHTAPMFGLIKYIMTALIAPNVAVRSWRRNDIPNFYAKLIAKMTSLAIKGLQGVY